MKEEYYLNQGNCKLPKMSEYLIKNNYLSEYNNEFVKLLVRDNLGITDLLNILKQIIDAKVIEVGGVNWDSQPTEGHTENILSSDALYKLFLKYVTELELDKRLLKIFSTLNTRINEELSLRRTEDLNLSERIDILLTLYNSLKETLYQQLISSIINTYETRIKTMETKVDSFLKSSASGTSFTDSFGYEDYIGINQATITTSINNIWNKIEELSGLVLHGINLSTTPEYFISEDEATIHIKALSIGENEVFEHIALYSNGILITEAENVESLEYDLTLLETSVIKCVAMILGTKYTKQTVVTHYNSFWLGAGNNYESIMNVEHIIPITEGLRGAYNININDGEKIFIIISNRLPEFIRADMSGIEIPFEELEITIGENTYKVYTSVNTYDEGIYNIDING